MNLRTNRFLFLAAALSASTAGAASKCLDLFAKYSPEFRAPDPFDYYIETHKDFATLPRDELDTLTESELEEYIHPTSTESNFLRDLTEAGGTGRYVTVKMTVPDGELDIVRGVEILEPPTGKFRGKATNWGRVFDIANDKGVPLIAATDLGRDGLVLIDRPYQENAKGIMFLSIDRDSNLLRRRQLQFLIDGLVAPKSFLKKLPNTSKALERNVLRLQQSGWTPRDISKPGYLAPLKFMKRGLQFWGNAWSIDFPAVHPSRAYATLRKSVPEDIRRQLREAEGTLGPWHALVAKKGSAGWRITRPFKAFRAAIAADFPHQLQENRAEAAVLKAMFSPKGLKEVALSPRRKQELTTLAKSMWHFGYHGTRLVFSRALVSPWDRRNWIHLLEFVVIKGGIKFALFHYGLHYGVFYAEEGIEGLKRRWRLRRALKARGKAIPPALQALPPDPDNPHEILQPGDLKELEDETGFLEELLPDAPAAPAAAPPLQDGKQVGQ